MKSHSRGSFPTFIVYKGVEMRLKEQKQGGRQGEYTPKAKGGQTRNVTLSLDKALEYKKVSAAV